MGLNFAARLDEMEQVEREYRALDGEGRLAVHLRLRFYDLLATVEHAVLERRFPGELELDPRAPELTTAARESACIAWDYRCRELVLAMLGFADEVLAAKLDLASRFELDADGVALALTATGSIVELGRPVGRLRAFMYRPSARSDAFVQSGHAVLPEAVRLGNRIRLGDLVTSEVLVLAVGLVSERRTPRLPTEAAPARFRLFGDGESRDALARGKHPTASRLDAVRFRVLAEAVAALPVGDEALPAAEERLVALAVKMQDDTRRDAEVQAYLLGEVSSFATDWGVTYEVERGPGDRFILIGTRPNDTREIVLASVDIGRQRVVVGAPLVMRVGALGPLAALPRVAALKPLAG